MRGEYELPPVNQEEESTDCSDSVCGDTLSDNHDVIAADGRVADIGTCRGASGFLDSHLSRDQDGWKRGLFVDLSAAI